MSGAGGRFGNRKSLNLNLKLGPSQGLNTDERASASSVIQPVGTTPGDVPRPGVSMRPVSHKSYPRRTAMRNAILAMTVALTLGTGELRAAAQKPDVGPGRIARFDITTTDLSRLKEFYGKLFD